LQHDAQAFEGSAKQGLAVVDHESAGHGYLRPVRGH
jgi:hypothetical protein